MIKQNHRFIAKGILSIHKYHPFGGTRYHVNLIHRQNLDMGPNLGQKAICRIEGDILFPPIPCSKIVSKTIAVTQCWVSGSIHHPHE